MKIYIFILLIIILISATGCETVPSKLATPSQPVISKPLLTHWEMVGNPMVTQDDFTCLINGFYFSNNRILVFYSLIGSTSDKLATDEIFQIIDDSGAVSPLVEIIPLGIIDQLELGIMVFEPRRIGIRDIYLSTISKSDPKINQKTALAHLIGSIADDHVDRIFYRGTVKNSEFGEYQISILWSAPPENQTGGADSSSLPESTPLLSYRTTPTVVIRAPAISVPPGVFLQDEFSFKVENINKKQAQYLGGQLYSDGTVASISDGTTVIAAPIVLITPTPINLPYPPPRTLPSPLQAATPRPLPYP
jgi:hypothetical protein